MEQSKIVIEVKSKMYFKISPLFVEKPAKKEEPVFLQQCLKKKRSLTWNRLSSLSKSNKSSLKAKKTTIRKSNHVGKLDWGKLERRLKDRVCCQLILQEQKTEK